VANAYRVLTSEGKVSDGFRWTPQDAGGDVRARLSADGVRFTANGAADPAQRLSADELASLVGEADGEEDAARRAPESPGEETRADRFYAQLVAENSDERRFFRRLAAHDSPETVDAVRVLFAHWEELGGSIHWVGNDTMSSAFLTLVETIAPSRWISPMSLMPGSGWAGSAYVAFKALAVHEPFTDHALRAEFLRRLNELVGVDLQERKPGPDPSFQLSVLEKDRNRELLVETLTWFRDRWESRGTD
jgi:hypothetical protein